MALPKWMEDFLASEAVKNLVKLAVLTAVMAILNYFQAEQINSRVDQAKQEAVQEVNVRVKKSENLIQQTVTENAAAVAAVVTNTPAAEVAPIVEEAAAEVE